MISGDPAPVAPVPGERWAWIYFGRSTERYRAWRRAVEPWAEALDAAGLVNGAAERFRRELIDFDDVLAYRSPLRWHASDLAERDPYNSQFLYRCASALAFEHVLDSLATNLLVAVDGDSVLARKLARRARDRGFRAGLTGAASPGRDRLRALRHRTAARTSFLSGFLDVRRRLRRLGRRRTLRRDVDTLLFTWAHPSSFAPGVPIEHEPFSGALPALLRASGRNVGFLVCPMSWAYPYEEVLANVAAVDDEVLLLEECVGLRDALRICAQTLARPARRVAAYVVAGLDLSDLLDDELRREAPCWVLQFACVGKALARRGVRPGLVIHPFENHSWEKALRLGLRRYLPESRIVGHQHSTVHFGPSSHYPSRRDLAEWALPDAIVVNGRLWGELLIEHGFPAERLRQGPALRFTHVLARIADGSGPASRGSPRDVRILVPGSGEYDETLEVAVKAVEALAERAETTLLVKLHPSMPGRERFVGALGRIVGRETLPANVHFTEEPIGDLLTEVDVLLHPTTSTAYEALAYGLPAVYVRPDFWLDRDPLPPTWDVGPSARSPEELQAVVERVLAEGDDERRDRHERAKVLLASAFTPVGDEAVGAFVEDVPGELRQGG